MLYTRSMRDNIGYQIDVLRPHPMFVHPHHRINKNHYTYDGYNTSMDYIRGGEKGLQYGGAIDFDTIQKTLNLLYEGSKLVSKAYSSEVGTQLKNSYGKFMNKSNPNWRPGFAGEKHMLNTHGVTYNFLGPGTNLEARLKRGDPPLDSKGLDAAAKVHDIDYANAKNWNEVRTADKKFIKNVEASDINRASKTVIKGLFKAKMIGEDVGFVKPSDFTSFPNIQDSEPSKIEETQPSINVSGQGLNILRKVKKDPAWKLRNKMKKYKRSKGKAKLPPQILDIARRIMKK